MDHEFYLHKLNDPIARQTRAVLLQNRTKPSAYS